MRADALVYGIFEGMDWREARDDRKRERKRQDAADKRTEETHGWKREVHEAAMEDRNRRNAEAQRQRQQQEDERQVFKEAYEAAKESYDAAPGITGAQAPGEPIEGVNATPTVPDAVPVQPQAPEIGIMDVEPPSTTDVPAKAMTGYMPKPEGPDAPIPAQGREAISFEEWRAMSRSERQRMGLPVSELGGQWAYRDRNGAWSITDTPPPDDGPRMKGTPYANEIPPTRPRGEQPVTAPSGAPAAPPVPKTESGTPQVSVQSAQVTAPNPGIVGDGMPVKTTKQQRERAATSFLDHYVKVSAPKIIEHYVKTGQIEKAQAFEEFVQSRSAQDGMQGWARAVHAASIGDDEGFADGLADAYNATDYFDDGYSVVREDTEFTRDEQGNITGARVKIKNNETGQTFDQVFDGVDDIYRFGIGLLSPEAVFERGLAEVDRAQAVQEALIQKRAEVSQLRVSPEEVMEVIETLSSANLDFSGLSVAEQVDAALAMIEQIRGQQPGIGTATAPAKGASNLPTDVPLY